MDPLELNEFSDTINIYEGVCRICLHDNVILNWNNEIPEYFGLTYKECYYKYTQLELLVIDPYSEMLCETCATSLKESHFLIIKALESHAILERTHLAELQITEIEIEEVKEESYVASEENTGSYTETLEISIQENKKPKWKNKDIYEKNEKTIKTIASSSSQLEQISSESVINSGNAIIDYSDDEEFDMISQNMETFNNGKSKKYVSQNKNDSSEILTSKQETKKKYMCSNCSKVFINMRSLIRHEETHNNNRERSVICKVCGIKFFTKYHLTLHLKTHNEFREKKHKCEFCEKAYFNKGSLNIHRRIHLGQMIPCPLCPKEFYRQDDLNRHNVTAHASTTIHTNIKKKAKYYVYCTDCNKQLRTTSWKAHQAAHLNEPLMKCTICHKEFFTRDTVTHHMHKVHNYKTRAEYEQFILYTKPKRLSHLWLEQQDTLKLKSNE